VNVDVQGQVIGNQGGTGGDASALPPVPLLGTAVDCFADAAAGCGGNGGDILVCATDSIHVGRVGGAASIDAGNAGGGGNANAVAQAGYAAQSAGGHGLLSGNVIFRGMAADCQVFVDVTATVTGGGSVNRVRAPGSATAQGGGPWVIHDEDGASAEAWGGSGTKGGTVIFEQCKVVAPHGMVNGGAGADGGMAQATGGDGYSGTRMFPDARKGGTGPAHGGRGGAAGKRPTIPLTDGRRDRGGVQASGHGGSAEATAGVPGQPFFMGRTAGPNTSEGKGGIGGDGHPGEVKIDPQGQTVVAQGG
jgi:hypothetical protein